MGLHSLKHDCDRVITKTICFVTKYAFDVQIVNVHVVDTDRQTD